MASSERDRLMEETFADLDAIEQKWDEIGKRQLGFALATDWISFLVRFRSPQRFAKMYKESQLEYLGSLATYGNSLLHNGRSADPTISDGEAYCASLSASLFAAYLTTLIENDVEFGKPLSTRLDRLALPSWEMAFAVSPYELSELLDFIKVEREPKFRFETFWSV